MTITSIDEDGKHNSSVAGMITLENKLAGMLKLGIFYNTAAPVLGVLTLETCTHVPKETWTRLSTAALFVIRTKCKQARFSSVEKWINTYNINTIVYYTALKINFYLLKQPQNLCSTTC